MVRPFDSCLLKKAQQEKLLTFSSLPIYTDRRIISVIRKATKANNKKRYQNTSLMCLDLHSLGKLPSWRRLGDELICEYHDNKYRIIKERNNGYIVQRNYSNQKWSKQRGSTFFDSEAQAIGYLFSLF